MPSYAGYDYEEHVEDMRINIGDQPSATRKLICDGSDAIRLANALRGKSLAVAETVIFSQGASHPLIDSLKVNNVQINYIGTPEEETAWSKALLSVSYSLPEYDDADQLTIEADLSGEVKTIAASGFEMEDGGSPEHDLQVVIPFVEFSISKARYPKSPMPKMINLLGAVNDDTFQGAAAGTVLYLGGSINKQTTAEGNVEWEAAHQFAFSKHDHRKQFNSRTGRYETVTNKTTGETLYEAKSFNPLGVDGIE